MFVCRNREWCTEKIKIMPTAYWVAELSGLVHEQSDTLCELKKKLEENIKKNQNQCIGKKEHRVRSSDWKSAEKRHKG